MTDRDPLDDFTHDTFTHDGTTKRVFRKGEEAGDGSHPGVVVITEIPGITPYVADFARTVVDAGFTVAMPDLFGEAGRPMSVPYMASSMARACVSAEFKVFASKSTSPVVDWLRPLGRDLHERCGGPGIGAIGMCLTGNFALAMAVDDHLLAPVLSQPSLPIGPTPSARRALHISDEDLATVKRRAEAGLPVLGMRFASDPLCGRPRFDRLEQELGDAFIRVELPGSSRNPRGRPNPPHSVVTTDLVDEPGQPTREALDRVLQLFRDQLMPSGSRA